MQHKTVERQAIILLSSLRSVLRGVMISAIKRRENLIRKGILSKILTFDYCRDYYLIVKNLYDNDYISSVDGLVNIFDYYRSKVYVVNDEASPVFHIPNKEFIGVEKFRGKDDRVFYHSSEGVVVNYLREDGTPYLSARVVDKENKFLWEKIISIELLSNDGKNVVECFKSTREFWAYFIKELAEDKETHVFQDASFYDKQLQTDIFYKIYESNNVYNYRVAHGATQVDMSQPLSKPIHSLIETLENPCDALIFLTDEQRYSWFFLSQNLNLVTIPHEVEVSTYIDKDRPFSYRFITVTTLSKLKRVDHAIRAFAAVVDEYPNAVLDIYGQGPLEEELKLLIDDLSMGNNIFLKGYSLKAWSLFENYDCSLITSERETFSMPIIESFSYGCPVISYDIPYGPRSMIINGYNGYLAQSGDIKKLQGKILEIIEQTKINTMRENAHKTAMKYSSDIVGDKIIDLMFQSEFKRNK